VPDAVVIEPPRRYKLVYQRVPTWTLGESDRGRNFRAPGREATPYAERYPDNYPGKIQSVVPLGTDTGWACGEVHDVREMDLTAQQVQAARDHRLMLKGGALVPVSLEDRWGALADELRGKVDRLALLDTRTDFGEGPQRRELKEKRRWFSLYLGMLVDALPRTEAHTGTGYYEVDTSAFHSTGNSISSVVGQVVTFTKGHSLLATEYGGYVVNDTRGETRSVISIPTSDSVELEGDLSSWIATDSCTAWTAWTTFAGASTQLETDQGGSTFTADQEIYVKDGTYNEQLELTQTLVPSREYYLLIEGESEAGTIFDNGASTACYMLTGGTFGRYHRVKNFTFTGTDAVTVYVGYATNHSVFENCTVTNSGANKYNFDCNNTCVRVISCTFPDGRVDDTGGCVFSGCIFKGGDYVESGGGTIFDCCVFQDDTYLYFQGYGATVSIRHCIFYSFSGSQVIYNTTYAPGRFSLINCIFDAIDIGANVMIRSIAKLCDVVLEGNCYNITSSGGLLTMGNDTDYADLAALRAAGYDAGGYSMEADPLMTDPGSDDFTLAANSPCRGAGAPCDVLTDFGGTDFNEPRDIGAYAYTPTGQTQPEGLALTDLASGGELKATITNTASYGDTDLLYFYDGDGDEICVITKAAYVAANEAKAANCALITGLTQGEEYVITCKASGNGRDFSAASDSATETPTGATAPGAPSISAVSASGTTLTATIDGDDGADNYIDLRKKADGSLIEEDSRTGDGDVELEADTTGQGYDLVPFSKKGGLYGKPGAPYPVFVSSGSEHEDLHNIIRSRFKTYVADVESVATQYDNDGGSGSRSRRASRARSAWGPPRGTGRRGPRPRRYSRR